MSISSVIASGQQGLRAACNRTESAATALNVEDSEFARKMVAMRQGEIEAKAAAQIVRTGDQILETLVTIRR